MFKSNKRQIIVSGVNAIAVLTYLHSNRITDVLVYNCGTKEYGNLWALTFKVDDKKWDKVVVDLAIIRIWKMTQIPKDSVAVWSMD